jgi:DDE superfamily endonuclease
VQITVHKKHGMNLQVIASPDGDILWVSGALPGSVHDKKAAWIWDVLAELEAAGLVTLADKGYQGSAYAKIPLGEEQARIAERGQPGPRETPRTRRKSKRAAQDLAHPPQAALLPPGGRAARQGHPRPP